MKGFVKVTAMSPNVVLGDVKQNVFHITNQFNSNFDAWNSDVIVFPELCLTGSTLGDLFINNNLVKCDIWRGIDKLKEFQKNISGHCPIFIVGAPIEYNNNLFNCAIVLHMGEIKGIVPKCYLKDDDRWFSSGSFIKDKDLMGYKFGSNLIFNTGFFKFGIEIGDEMNSIVPPSSFLSLAGAEIIFNLGSSHEFLNNREFSTTCDISFRCKCGYVYASSGYGESSTDKVFVPKSIVSELGTNIDSISVIDKFKSIKNYKSTSTEIDINKIRLSRKNDKSFKNQGIIDGYTEIEIPNLCQVESLTRKYDRHPFKTTALDKAFNIQVSGLIRRLDATSGNIVIGVSGGSDSTLALLVCYEALKRRDNKNEMIHGITMPCYGTTDRTKDNSIRMMNLMSDKVIGKKIMISRSVTQHRKDIELDKDDRSITYENCQARERTQVLMDYANKVGAIVVGTGDMSELALGWCTYNADHMSMYNVNAGVPKTMVKDIIQWYANEYCRNNSELFDVLIDVLQTPVSPELLPDQVTENSVGPYELHDFFLYHIMKSGWDANTLKSIAIQTFRDEYDEPTITKWLNVFYKRFMSQQFKRSCMPDGPKITDISLSPRGSWIMPSDISINLRV